MFSEIIIIFFKYQELQFDIKGSYSSYQKFIFFFKTHLKHINMILITTLDI